MAYENPCNLSSAPVNTGSECDSAMLSTQMIWLVPKHLKIPANVVTTPGGVTAYLTTQMHATPSLRIFPIFGNAIPVRSITDANESDVLFTFEDGSTRLIRRGMMARTFVTDKGGLCLAQHYMSLNGDNFAFIEVDTEGKINWMTNSDGTFSGFPANLIYAPTPELANLKTPYQNKFYLNFSPNYYIKRGKIIAPDSTEDVLDLTGLLDTVVTPAIGATQSVTNIFVNVETVCGQTDLVSLLPGSAVEGAMAQITNFGPITLSVSPFTVVTPTAALAIPAANGNPAMVKLTGTFVSGSSYLVPLAPPATLLANGVEGYDGGETLPATVTIP